MKRNEPEVWRRVRKIFLLEDYLLYRMTGRFVTEKTLQSSSLYFDISAGVWWDEMLEYIGVDRSQLPELRETGDRVGEYMGSQVVCGCNLDQIAGACGSGTLSGGRVSEMTGTTMAIYVPTERRPEYDPNSIIPCHYAGNGKYCLLLWTPTAGMALKWYRNTFCPNVSFKELDAEAAKIVPGCGGLTFLPYLCGSTMPKYNPEVRGCFYGIGLEHTRAHFTRAVLESVACMLRENLEALGCAAEEIRSTGGGADSPLWCRIKADMTGRQIVTLSNRETACGPQPRYRRVRVGGQRRTRSSAADKVYPPSGVDYLALDRKLNVRG